jgi:broad specificity phosphatase PhoE
VTPPPHDDDDDDEDASSSSSSSEAFLWTKAGTNKEKRRPVDRVVSKPTTTTAPTHTTASTTWMGRLRKTVAGLTHDDEFSTTKPIDQQQQHPSQSIPQNYASMRRSASTPEVAAMNAAANAAPATSNNNNRTAARAQYNARIMPNKVVMVRHGQSEGNLNELLYSTTPDNAMRLTKLGWNQALETGKVLKNQVLATGEPIHFIVSPYVRTVETFHGLVSAWCDPKEFNHIPNREKRLTAWYSRLLELGLTWHEDPRIREQDFGNYQVPLQIQKAKQERHRFGPFFYRFPHGESASDVFDRVSTFLDSLWRSFDMNRSRNYVLVTHGISIRVLLARYFRYSIDQFSLLANPKNCEMVILGHDGAGKLQLDGRCELKVEENEETGEPQVRGHEFHKRLRVLPKRFVHKLNVRVSYDDQIGPPLVVGFDTNVVDIQEALIDAGGEPSKVPPRSDLATELHRAQSLGR